MAKQPKAGKVGESAKEKKGKRSAAAKLRREVGSGKTIAKPLSDREADLDCAPKWQPRYPGSGRLDGKVAIVTGGDSGSGRRTEEHKSAPQSTMSNKFSVCSMTKK